VNVFGHDAEELNFDRDITVLGRMLTFNGNQNDIVHGIEKGDYNSPPRRCPGYSDALAIIKFLVNRYRPRPVGDVPTISQARLEEIKSKESFFQKFVLNMGQATYKETNKYFPTASDVKHPLDTNGKSIGCLPVVAAGERTIPVYGKTIVSGYDRNFRIRLPHISSFVGTTIDEDVPVLDMWKDNMTAKVLSLAPISDDEGEWNNCEEAVAWRTEWFNANFPPVNTDYTGAKSMSRLVSEIAFAGICCLRTQTVDSLPPSAVARRKCEDSGAVYVNDNTDLGKYRVRRGYEKYGAAAYFDAQFNLIGIYTCSSKKYLSCPERLMALHAQDNAVDLNLEDSEFSEWRHAMWTWRVSALAQVTVADHLVNVHMIAANSLVSASRTNLPIDHPVRAFLKIFTFRTIGINSKAYLTLIQRKGIVNRNWAFEADDLQELLKHAPNTFKKNFKEYIHESMRNVIDYPPNQDLTDFCDVVTKLVHDFLCVIYESPGDDETERYRLQRNIDNDPAFQAFLRGLADELDLVPSRDLSSFDDIV
jgi:hypothetical protein